jgi:hypothetical protein
MGQDIGMKGEIVAYGKKINLNQKHNTSYPNAHDVMF